MTSEHEKLFENGRLNRTLFPDVDAILSDAGDEAAPLEKMGEKHLLTLRALDEFKLIHSGMKGKVETFVNDIKEDVRQVFDDEPPVGLKESALHVSKTVMDFLKGSAEEALKITKGGDDLVFLVGRLVQYRNALLEHVRLEDPIEMQEEMIGDAVLVYLHDRTAHSCWVTYPAGVAETLKDPVGVKVREASIGDKRTFSTLVKYLYQGRPGIVERKNILLVDAPQQVGLTIKQVLNKAACLYRDSCKDT